MESPRKEVEVEVELETEVVTVSVREKCGMRGQRLNEGQYANEVSVEIVRGWEYPR